MKPTKPNKTTAKYINAFFHMYVSLHRGEEIDPYKMARVVWHDAIIEFDYLNKIKNWNVHDYAQVVAHAINWLSENK